MNKRFRKLLKNPWILFCLLSSKGVFNFLNDEQYLKLMFRARMRQRLDLEDPKTFNEKLQWLKLYDRNPKYTQMVDKYEVRKHIAETIGQEYLIPLIGVWNNFDEIDFNQLPDQFVLKCTHDSGGVVICNEKSKLDLEAARFRINKCMKRNYYYAHREWPYKKVKPRIICEKYIVDESGTELKDYKFMCFNGKAKCMFVCLNRSSPNGLNVDFYDMNWKPMPFERHYPNSGTLISKPYSFDNMVEFAEKLSKGMPFVRADFYETKDQLYFGELTFYPGSGYEEFTPESYDYLLGSWLEVSPKNTGESGG